MATDSNRYQEQATLPFSSAELGAFHQFHAYQWDKDEEFQAGLRTITQSQPNPPSKSELLKMKQYYFSTRKDIRINLDNYLSWRKHLEKPSDDPNVPIFKRFDEYDFDNDPKFQKGLPSIIGQLVKDNKNALDKAALQKEMTKAKAFYYARFIELFDFPAYLEWKEMEKPQSGPVCPYAHLWQDKGKGSGTELAEDAQKFLTVTSPVSTGALQFHIHSPATKNVWTGLRLAKLSQAISHVQTENTTTSIFWTVNSGASSIDQRDPDSIIATKDEKWFNGGLVTSASTEPLTTQDHSKAKELLRQYYGVVSQLSDINIKHQKPVVMIVDGMVSLSAAYLTFGSGAQRVITENATLSFTPLESIESVPNELANPFAGIYLLSLIQANAKNDTSSRPLAKGVGYYLAFCPDYILRGPDLKKLGLADYFISSLKKKDIEEAILSVAGCPPPHTAQAFRMAINSEVAYPGPAKIDVWRSEIEECFGDAKSIKEIVTKLEKYDNNWSKSIRTYIASLDPVLADLLFEAIKRTSELNSFQDSARLEYRLIQRYKDYTSSSSEKTQDVDLESFFEPVEGEDKLFTFPFAEWIKENGHEDEFVGISADTTDSQAQDPTKTCPYLASKVSENNVPSDHPSIAGVDMADPEAVKACPFLSAKKSKEDKVETVPSDHPKIPGVNFSDPEAAKACPFLSAKKSQGNINENNTTSHENVPQDHPNIAGLNLSDPETVKACPFLSDKHNGQKSSTPSNVNGNSASSVPVDHPNIPGVDFSNPDAAKQCPYLASKSGN
ncbi:hypothetical protein BGZ46_000699 [Entomortierella lignicola]|nr:hypothetical protein BGZ46_000699 [Entomortierella lignicola]